MERVQKVNQDDYFVAQVTGVILFGSMLRLEVDKLGDVDIAVQIEAKERSIERFRQLNI
jgi:predicted nucleotidyltransferase